MISKKMSDLSQNSSIIRAMFEEGKRLSALYGAENVYDYSIGNPSVSPPEEVKQAILSILEEEDPLSVHGYMNNSGYEDVREAIAQAVNAKQHTAYQKENVVMTCGAAGGLNILLKTLLDPGDEVIVLAPFFGEYANYVANYDGILRVVQTDPESFQPDLGKLEAGITARTKAVILNTPNNPTGVVYPARILCEMAELFAQKEKEFGSSIYVISDEPYREIVYDGVEVPFMLSYFHNGIIGYSYSKSLSLPGERIGYLLIPESVDCFAQMMVSLNVANRILGFVNAPSLFQRVIARSLQARVDTEIYRQNRDLLYEHLLSLGFSCVKPQGAFYLFPKCPTPEEADFLARAKAEHILLVAGTAFHAPGHFRLSYCIDKEKIERSLPAFTRLMRQIASF